MEAASQPRRARLSSAVIEGVQRQILSGALRSGDQLPTEQQLIGQYGVSRTVVREAVSALRANGLVEARQGSGVFATGRLPQDSLALSDSLASLYSALDLLELRTPIEVEAAGLAAQRRSPSQDMAIRIAFQRLSDAIARDENSVSADFELHLAIVRATNNQSYVDVLTFLGQKTIPRGRLQGASIDDSAAYLQGVQAEHARIVEAIGDQDATRARDEMRRHLSGSHARYRTLATRIDPTGGNAG